MDLREREGERERLNFILVLFPRSRECGVRQVRVRLTRSGSFRHAPCGPPPSYQLLYSVDLHGPLVFQI